MAHGFSAVKEQVLPEFAERFVDAGLATLVFDYRYFGDSEGEPRCQLFPLEMVEDYRNAITWACEQPNVDPDRLGVWGTSYSGGLVAYVGTFDRRVRAVVAQVPSIINAESRLAITKVNKPFQWMHVLFAPKYDMTVGDVSLHPSHPREKYSPEEIKKLKEG